jgi:MFS family permease
MTTTETIDAEPLDPEPARVSISYLVVLSLYGLTLSMTANVLDPPVFTAKVNQILADERLRNTALGLLTFSGLVVAAFAQPIWGALSDRTRTPWGRRLPFLLVGSLVNALLFFVVALTGEIWVLALTIVAIQVSSNAIQGAYQGFIPDQVPAEQHGVAASVKSLMEVPAVVVGPLVAGLILGLAYLSVTSRILLAVGILQGLYITVGLVTFWRVRDRDIWAGDQTSQSRTTQQTLWQTVRGTFHLDWDVTDDLRWWLVNRALFWCALLILRTFLINYVEQVIHLSPEEAQRVTGILSFVLGLIIFVILLPSGYIIDRVGARTLLISSGLLATVGATILVAARSLTPMFGAGVLIGLGGGFFVTASWALVTRLVPREGAARYLGIANLATAAGSAAARLTGLFIDGINHYFNSQTLGYVSVYALSGVLFLVSAWAISHISSDRTITSKPLAE